jgi:hypothetical protein
LPSWTAKLVLPGSVSWLDRLAGVTDGEADTSGHLLDFAYHAKYFS